MRLYLSSHRLGDRPGALLALLGGGRRAAIIGNALDAVPLAVRERYRRDIHDPAVELGSLGLACEPLDLRDYFDDQTGLAARLRRYDLCWVMGGNSFILRRAMRQSGFDDLITELLEADRLVYGGCSAGAVVATPTLRGIEQMDDPHDVPEGYDPAVVWDGLGLIDHALVPHYRSASPESAAADRVARVLSARGQRYRALRDGEVVIWTEDRRRPVEQRSA